MIKLRTDLTKAFAISLLSLLFAASALGRPAQKSSLLKSRVYSIPYPNIATMGNKELLSKNEAEEINETLSIVNNEASIIGKVCIVPELNGESIENLASEARGFLLFHPDQKRYGAVIVISKKEKIARVELGSELQEQLSEEEIKKILDEGIGPRLKHSDLPKAIIQGFNSLAYLKTKKAIFKTAIEKEDKDISSRYKFNFLHGLISVLLFWILLTKLDPTTLKECRRLAVKLAKVYPSFIMKNDKYLNRESYEKGLKEMSDSFIGRTVLDFVIYPAISNFKLFFGLIIFGISLTSAVFFYSVVVACSLIWYFYYTKLTGRYRSIPAYNGYCVKQRKRKKKYIDAGYMEEVSLGCFVYTEKYRKIRRESD